MYTTNVIVTNNKITWQLKKALIPPG